VPQPRKSWATVLRLELVRIIRVQTRYMHAKGRQIDRAVTSTTFQGILLPEKTVDALSPLGFFNARHVARANGGNAYG
jgi:hypothetical protein